MGSLPPGAVELVPDRLYALGGVVKNEDRISYVPAGVGGYLPINCYLVKEGSQAVLVDTGAACHRDQVLGQLHDLLEKGSRLSVFMTRPEGECIGNLDAVLTELGAEHVYGGGTLNPFDFIDDVLDHMMDEASDEDTVAALTGRQLQRKRDGEYLELAAGRRLRVFAAPLRILTTFWLYDESTGALFCSDFFSHNMIGRPGDEQVVRAAGSDDRLGAAEDEMRAHLCTKFEWLSVSDTAPVKGLVQQLLDSIHVEFIAPSYGSVVAGREAVDDQLATMYRILTPSRQLV
jgi:flavorubredoxin